MQINSFYSQRKLIQMHQLNTLIKQTQMPFAIQINKFYLPKKKKKKANPDAPIKHIDPSHVMADAIFKKTNENDHTLNFQGVKKTG